MSSTLRWSRLPEWPLVTWGLRAALLVLPVAALLLAWPDVASGWVMIPVVVCAVRWCTRPEDVAGPLVLVLVMAWWGVHLHGTLAWQLPVVAACLLGAHVCATLASYGPGELALARAVAWLWLRRTLWACVPVPVVLLVAAQVEGAWAPVWLWGLTVAAVLAVVVWASVATRAVPQ